ncbi:MAG: tRNA (N6-isopentenyl adenosine(37)-C2)-methylthiotransferase MiaB [Oscillospiraceae bacterium]
MPPLAYLHSFGCQQNVSDGEKIKGMLSLMGYNFTDVIENADLIIYNTCAVRENAEAKVFGLVGELKHLKEKNSDLVIALCGCMTQQEHIAQKVKKTYKQVDIVFGTFAMYSFPKMLYEVLTEKNRVYDISETDTLIHEDTAVVRDGEFKASVPIIYGCNNFCTYCVVPYVRGRERSRNASDILSEVKTLVNNGYKEIMLLGQNVNSYGKDLKNSINFSGLLREINKIDGDFKIRFMSSHPKDATFELIDTIIDCEKVCKHLHLPVQSGSNQILKAMNRNYTRERYLEIVNYARQKQKDFAFSSDIIVGFPNETYQDFLQTKSLVEQVKFDNIYTFIYSKRIGTKAAEMVDNTADSDKTLWMRELLSTQRELASAYNRRFIGKTVTVLAENEREQKDGFLTGRTDEFIIAEFKAPISKIGKFVKVKITDAHNWSLVGEII